LDRAKAHVRQLQTDLDHELQGRLELRRKYGARPRESFSDFIARLAADGQSRPEMMDRASLALFCQSLADDFSTIAIGAARAAKWLDSAPFAGAGHVAGGLLEMETGCDSAIVTLCDLEAALES
jgi:hypothetical protein